ncbi:cell division protein [Bacillaceae bacterium SIJ1]|uniref:pilus assembly protein PilM n=1 Tax=Litoribacterium kuwaitense TaxID=1398745 RepID=UPI0013EAF40A|nr:pilus assembly protein PilM [Litoribacterium kuwaitense]NGP44200.1 cell division protein [Litoribacterium kuwaitense]
MTHSPIFTLDIGTRSVVGLILEQSEQGLSVKHAIIREHTNRAMVDGQIHNIAAVAQKITEIKTELEGTYGPLTKACVAAAGRALKTMQAHATWDISEKGVLQPKDIQHLEIEAVQKARMELAASDAMTHKDALYCVGFSVVRYYLDEEEIGSLLDQRGKRATVEVIATFLPQVVVDSLISALHKAGLELQALTLEPIAAMHVLVPESMRRLNIALVDIGAGTSDIALTDLGTVTAYGMVPIAGDEISEAVSDAYLLDFYEAENAKKNIIANGSADIEDILGFPQQVTLDMLVKELKTATSRLASSIAQEILQLNKRAPQAVMLIGGGSLTPGLPEALADELQLPKQRVAVRDSSVIKDIDIGEHLEASPAFVTPLGIASAALQNPIQYKSVQLNGQPVRMFDSKPLTVKDVLLASGIQLEKYYGALGLGLFITINGTAVMIPGERGQSPSIFVNGALASLDTRVENRDELTLKKGDDGANAHATLRDVLGDIPSLSFSLNDEPVELAPRLQINGIERPLNTILSDGDQVTWTKQWTVEEALDVCWHENRPFTETITVLADESPIELDAGSHSIMLNGQPASIQTTLDEGDRLDIQPLHVSLFDQLCQRTHVTLMQEISIMFNGQAIKLTKPTAFWTRANKKLDSTSVLKHDDQLQLKTVGTKEFIFQDVFSAVDITVPTSGSFSVRINGYEASFQDKIRHGDELELLFHHTDKNNT